MNSEKVLGHWPESIYKEYPLDDVISTIKNDHEITTTTNTTGCTTCKEKDHHHHHHHGHDHHFQEEKSVLL